MWSIVLMLLGVGCLWLAGAGLFHAGPCIGRFFVQGPWPSHWRPPDKRPLLMTLVFLGVAGVVLWLAGRPFDLIGAAAGMALGMWWWWRLEEEYRESQRRPWER